MIIVYIVAAVIFFISAAVFYMEDDSFVGAIAVGAVMGGIAWAVTALIILNISNNYIDAHMSEMTIYTSEVRITQIKSLNDNTGNMSGSFFLGTGNIGPDSRFYFYACYSDSTYMLKDLNADRVTIVESDFRKPCVVKYESHIDWSRTEISLFLFKLEKQKYRYEIYVPENTIIIQYNLDTK